MRPSRRSIISLLLLIGLAGALLIVNRELWQGSKTADVVSPPPPVEPAPKKKPKAPRRVPEAYSYKRWAVLASEALKADGTADLITAAMSQAGYQLVERDQLSAVTNEQQLLAVAANGAANRVQLGKLLQADALLLLSTEKAGEKTVVKLTIADTRQGARLRAARLPSGNTAALVAGVVQSADEARDRFAQGVKWVVAVPHFLSKDIAHDFDHLQSSFASLLENQLALAPGVAVLETEEADSVRRELDLNAGQVDRVVPLFIVGSYETTRVAPATQPAGAWPVNVSFSIEISDGARVIKTFERKSISLTNTAELMSRELPAAILGTKLDDLEPLDSDQQFELLVARADAFAAVAAWDHSIALREAAILVKPDDIKQRKLIVRQVEYWNDKVYWRMKQRESELAQAHPPAPTLADWHEVDQAYGDELDQLYATFHPLWLRCWDHFEMMVRRKRDTDPELGRIFGEIAQMQRGVSSFRARPDAVAQTKLEMQERYVKALQELGPILAGDDRQNALKYLATEAFLKMTSRANLPRLARLIDELDEPSIGPVYTCLQQIVHLKDSGVLLHPTDEVDYPALVAVLLKSRHPSIILLGRFGQLWIDDRIEGNQRPGETLRDRATALEREMSDSQEIVGHGIATQINFTDSLAHLTRRSGVSATDWRAADLDERAPKPNPAGPISYCLFPLHVRTGDGKNPLLQHWEGTGALTFLPCGEGVDVVWTRKGIFMHREAGFLDPVLVDSDEKTRDVVWDGEQIWAGSGRQGIHVLDRKGAILGHVGAAQSLPPADQKILLHAISPGRIFACGSFGDDHRGWCAIVERHRDGRMDVNVFHRAMTHLDRNNPDENYDDTKVVERRAVETGLCFIPVWMSFAPAGPGSPSGRMWLRRDDLFPGNRQSNRILRVDLASLKVDTVPFENIDRISPVRPPVFLDSERALVFSDGKLFEASFGTPLSNGRQWRFVFAGGTNPFTNPEQLLQIDDKWYLPGPEWFRFDLTRLTASHMGPGVKWGGIRLAGSDVNYCQSSVCGPIGWNTYCMDFVQISMDPKHPLKIRADDGSGPRMQANQPQRTAGKLYQFSHGELIVVDLKHREFYSGRGCLVVYDMDAGKRRFGIIEPALFSAEEEEEWLGLVARTLEYPEEIQRLGLTPDQLEKFKRLPSRQTRRHFNPNSPGPSAAPPAALRERRDWTDEAKFRELYEIYDKAGGVTKDQARDAIFAAVRDAGDERRKLAAESIKEIQRILTPAQFKAIRFEAP